MRIHALWFTVLFVSSSCSGRQPLTIDGEPSRHADAGGSSNTSCPYPNGTCDWDSNCPAGQRCVGAMHTTGVPHAFICRGICQPKAGTTPCDPKLDYRPSATLARQGDKVIAWITNGGCKTIYRSQGCCGEGAPIIERPLKGGWGPACNSTAPKTCCAAEPTCKPLLPGQTIEERIPTLESVDCCGTTFRVSYTFSRSASCVDDALYPSVVASSDAVKLRGEDPCDGPPPAP
jgi:hypothetical protein